MYRGYLIFFFVILAYHSLSAKQPVKSVQPVFLTDSLEEVWIDNDYALYYEDTSALLTIEDIALLDKKRHFNLINTSDFINKNTASAYWIRVQFIDKRLTEKPFRLELFDFDINEISFFTPDKDGDYFETKAGYSLPFDDRETNHKNVGFYLPMDNRDTLVTYMRFKADGVNMLKPVLRSYNRTLNYGLTEYILFGIFYGFLLLVIFTNLVYFIMMGKAHYLYYVIYALSITIYLMAQNGTGFQYLWPSAPLLNSFMEVISLFTGIVGMLLFSIYFLGLKTKAKKLYKIGLIAVAVRTLLFLLQLSVPKLLPWLVIDVLFVQFAFLSGWWLYRIGDWSAKWFVLAFTFLNVAFIITALERLGLVASGAHTVYALNIGIVVQFLILSIGNAESVKKTYKERNETQKRLIQEFERNEALKEKVNKELEEKVLERTLELKVQKEIVEYKNKQIISSVKYAQTIQTAALPSSKALNRLIEKHCLVYLPRDIVSGDFYWTHQINEHEYLLAAVDCTGHGVPGAFMSMIGINILNRIVANDILEPAKILSQLHEDIQKVLKQKTTGNRDGMDMVLCRVDKKAKTLSYAGAKNPLLIFQDGKINRIRGTRFSIGGAEQDSHLNFDEHHFSFADGPIRFYLQSDGYVDQFGGPKNKKFMQRQLNALLENNAHVPIENQGKILKDAIIEWMGNYPQIDDIMLIGVEES